jgi:hypothetical protein
MSNNEIDEPAPSYEELRKEKQRSFQDSKKTELEKHNIISEKFGNNFCAAPWTSFWISPQGNTTFCCMSRDSLGNTNDTPLKDILNGEKANNIRKELLEGKFPSYCNICKEITERQNGVTASNMRDNNNKGFYTIFDAVENTDDQGRINGTYTTWIDINFSNKCNFACVGCTPELSDTIKRRYKESYMHLYELENEEKWNNRWAHLPADDRFNNNEQETIDYILENADTINRIHLNGGEPWMQEGFYKLLDALVERGYHEKIKLWTHTNGSIRTWQGRNFIEEYLAIWRESSVSASCDGVGARGEYIRWGYKDKKWLDVVNTIDSLNKRKLDESVERLESAPIPIFLNVQFCINPFNILTLEHHVNEILKLADGYVELDYWRDESVRGLPGALKISKEFRKRAQESLLQFNEKFKNNYRVSSAMSNGILDLIENIEPFNEEDTQYKARYFIKAIESLDKQRGTDFHSTFPELKFFYDELASY